MLVFFLLITTINSAQEMKKIGSHQQQLNEFGSDKKVSSKFNLSGNDIIPLQIKQAKALSKVVFGFLPYWEYTAGAHSNIHYNLLTHIAVFNFEASSTGAITNPSGWPWTDVINAAHNEGTKVIMAVTNFSASEIHTLLTNNTSKNNLFNNIKNTISTYQLDGVNIDFEGLNISDRGSVLNNFMSDLTNYIHTNLPGKEVSFDGPAVNWGGWNLDQLTQSVDFLFIMAYDYNGSWSTTTGAVSPLIHPAGGISVTQSLDNDYSVPISNTPEKLILGVPYYGKHWKTTTSSAGSTITSYVGSTFYKTAVIDAANHGGFIWDTNSQTPWYRWNAGEWNQTWQDNEESIDKKYDLALNKNLGGIGIWALNYDGNRSELWNLIDTKFNGLLGLDDFFIKQRISIYPNPAQSYLKISNPKNLQLTAIEIFNSYGQKIKDSNPKDKIIDISNLQNAIYFVNVRDENGHQAIFKIVKMQS